MRIRHLSAIVAGLVAITTGATAETIGGADVSRPRGEAIVQVPQAGPRPTAPLDHVAHGGLAIGGQGDGGAGADAAIDAMLGVVPTGQAAQGAKHIYVDSNGDLACVTLDTFFPQSC
jgi:hypothetical protein